MSFCNGNFQKRISRVEISRNFNGNFQGENFHFGNFHSLVRTGPHIMMMVVAYMDELPYVDHHTVGTCVERNRMHARGHVHVIPILYIKVDWVIVLM